MQNNKTRYFGYLVLSLGIFNLYIFLLHKTTELEALLDTFINNLLIINLDVYPRTAKIILLAVNLLFILVHFLAGIFLIKSKSIGSYLSLILAWLYIYKTFFILSISGLIYNELKLLIYFIIGILIIFGVSKLLKSLTFSKKIIRSISIILGSVFLILISSYSYLIIKLQLDTPGFETEFKKSSFIESDDIITFDFPPNFTVNLPIKSFKIFALNVGNYEPMIDLVNPKNSIVLILQENSFLQTSYKRIDPQNNKSELEFLKKLIKEDFGLIYLYLNGKLENDFLFNNNFMNFNLNNFEIVFHHNGNLGDYCIFEDCIEKGSLWFLKMNSGSEKRPIQYDSKFINKIVSSLRPWDKSKTSEQYFEEGLDYYKKEEYIHSIFKFISSLLLDKRNPQTRLYLAKAMIETEDFFFRGEQNKWNNIKNELEIALELDSENKEILTLYEMAKKKKNQ